MSKNNQIMPWHGIPREEIEWHPTVVDERCIGCGKYDVKHPPAGLKSRSLVSYLD